MSGQHPILVVEDDDTIRESLADVLRAVGYDVAEAENGEAALRWLSDNPLPCLILLDLYMPVMNGPTFRAHQLRDPRLAKVPVVVVSAADRQNVEGLGATAHLGKPIDLDALLSCVQRHC